MRHFFDGLSHEWLGKCIEAPDSQIGAVGD